MRGGALRKTARRENQAICGLVKTSECPWFQVSFHLSIPWPLLLSSFEQRFASAVQKMKYENNSSKKRRLKIRKERRRRKVKNEKRRTKNEDVEKRKSMVERSVGARLSHVYAVTGVASLMPSPSFRPGRK